MFRIFLFYLTLLGGILPVLYVYLVHIDFIIPYYAYNYVSQDSFIIGNLYTLSACVILLYTATKYSPRPLNLNQINQHKFIYSKYANLLFLLGIFSLIISIILFYIYGAIQVNLSSTRPLLATYAGYISRVLFFASELYIFYQIAIFNKLSKKGWILVFLILMNGALAESRAGLLGIFYTILFAYAYSFKKTKIKWSLFIIIFFIGTLAVLWGQHLRSGNMFDIIPQALLRFYLNNSVLYLAITDFDKIFNILMKDQPWTVLDQFLSFINERTLYPSSLRLGEFFGIYMDKNSSGHLVGYAYGWLGLTYGLFKWFGLFIIYIFFIIIFKTLQKIIKNPSLFKMIFLIIFSKILIEFFGNLGLDSFLEKIFKMSLSALILFLFIRFTYVILYYNNIIKKR